MRFEACAWSGRCNRARAAQDCRRLAPVRAFTLLEILLALALLGLLAAGLVSGASQLMDGRPKSPTEVFWEAARTARRTALKSETETRLSYDSKEKSFLVDDGHSPKSFPVAGGRELTIDLLHAQAGGSSVLIGGELVDTTTMPFVSFYPDGTCQPFRVQIRGTGPAEILSIDPWTCAPVLKEAKP
jgi:prepilin-type N-terminal cleavage/methylation domain-containing protein